MVFREREPEYQGKKLSEWLDMLDQTDDARAQAQIVGEALGNMGPEGLRWMLKSLRYEEPGWRSMVHNTVGRLPAQLVPEGVVFSLSQNKRWQRADAAAYMFFALGPRATNAIPELCRMMGDKKAGVASKRAVFVLASLGKSGLAPLLAALSDPRQSNRVEIVQSISEMGTNAGPAVPVLVKCLNDANVDLAVAVAAVLGDLKLEPQVAVPMLARALTNNDYSVRAASARALSDFGVKAAEAAPALVKALDDEDASVHKAAEWALLGIAPEEVEKDARTRIHEPPKVEHPFK
jgi:hypothetical protein